DRPAATHPLQGAGQLPPHGALRAAPVHAARSGDAVPPGYRVRDECLRALHPRPLRPGAVPATVPVRDRERLHAAQFAQLPLHGDREPGRVLRHGRTDGRDRAARGARGPGRHRHRQGGRQLRRIAARLERGARPRPHRGAVARCGRIKAARGAARDPGAARAGSVRLDARAHMTRAIVLHETGGPEKLRWETVEVGEPGADELRIRHTAIGVNFHDTYVRSGSYRTLTLPGIPGVEAAGVVERVGPGVSGFAPGNRVCYIDEKYGGYAEARLLPARLALRIP